MSIINTFFVNEVAAEGITNPALNLPFTTGEGFLQNFLPRFIGIGFVIGALIFLFMMLIGAIQWIASGGDKTAIEAARGRIMNALIGVVILFSLFAIFTLVSNFFGINLLQIDFESLKVGGGVGGGS
ncbi:hypothetical protein IID21_03485 [Patescibacteria group bacterium]|nr:hypothetical protein [Patescibacteria group bacterium]